ncbi:MAG TPA: DNA polymerase III subunit delta' [Rhodospirillales bacterium]|nr:DNA polymerase III subunit delta' [Rhodospirillales bacterium]
MTEERKEPPSPRHNPCLFGHEEALLRVRRAMERERMPHAWLLRGPKGVGKATLAWHLARELLAGPEGWKSCHDPDDPLFRQVASGAHPELYTLEGEGRAERRSDEIPVGEVRALLERLAATPSRAGYRVVMVEEADRLNRNAANALLKMLEEPPRGVVFLLVARMPAALPATIVSRCAQLLLRPLAEERVAAALRTLLDLPAERAAALASLSGGCIGRGVELAAGRFLEVYGRVLEGLATAASPADLLAVAGELRDAGGDRDGWSGFALLGEVLRRAVRAEAGMPPAVELVPRERAALAAVAARHPLDRLAALWDKLQALARRGEALHLEASRALIVFLDELAAIPEPGGGR